MGKHSSDKRAPDTGHIGKHRAGAHGSTAQMKAVAKQDAAEYDRLVREAEGKKK